MTHPYARRAALWSAGLLSAGLLLLGLSVGAAEAETRARTGGPTHFDRPALRQIDAMEAAWNAAHTLTYRMKKRERLRDGEMTYEESLVKLRRPGKIYLRRLAPREGQEVLYDAERDAGRLIAHPGHFPDLTLKLRIEGGLATKDQHHAVTSTGFEEVIQVLRRAIARARANPAGEQLRYLGTYEMEGVEADGIELLAGSAAPQQETALEDESLFDFARRVGMDAYPIFVANPDIGDLDDNLDGGKSYTIPAYYASRARIWIERASHLPVRVTMWNAEGRLYEDYRHFDIEVDPPLSAEDFSEDNPAYGF